MPKTSKLNIQQLIEEYDDVDMFFANVIFFFKGTFKNNEI